MDGVSCTSIRSTRLLLTSSRAPPEPGRTATKSTELRGARSEVANNLQETPNRRPGVERHMSRNSASMLRLVYHSD